MCLLFLLFCCGVLLDCVCLFACVFRVSLLGVCLLDSLFKA